MNCSAAAASGLWPPFTAVQWQELEHQALIFKYLKAGLPVPLDLLAPIRKSFDAIRSRFFHHPTLGYYSFYGKKVDPEPGRCRRTDGKKWRCSKDAYPSSKYCERHMNRSRHRSRKTVESKTTAVSQSLSTAASGVASGSSGGSLGFQNLPLRSTGKPFDLCCGGNASQLQQMEPIPYNTSDKDYRYLHGLKPEASEHNFLPEAYGSTRCPGINSVWHLMTSRVTSNPLSEPRNSSLLQSNCLQQDTVQDSVLGTVDPAMSKQQHYFFSKEFDKLHSGKQEHLSEGPKSKDLRTYIDYHRSNQSELYPTQLSMSTPFGSL